MNGMNDFEKWLAEEIRLIRVEQVAQGDKQDKTNEKVANIDKKLAVHKVKTGTIGAIGGSLVVGLRELVEALKASMPG